MIKTFIVGDLHIRKEQPFMKASIRILDILSEAVKENDRLIFLGDFFHTSRPYPEELNLAKKFFDTCKASITILAGNHEYLEARDSFSEYAFGEGEFKFYLDGDQEYPTICSSPSSSMYVYWNVPSFTHPAKRSISF